MSNVPIRFIVKLAQIYNEYDKENGINNPIHLNDKVLLLKSKEYKKYLSDQLHNRFDTCKKDCQYFKEHMKKYIKDDIVQYGGVVEDDKKCAPGIKFDGVSCISTDNLKKLAGAYNKYVENSIEIVNDKKELVTKLEETLKDKCEDQKCWVEQKFVRELPDGVKEELYAYTFVPDGPNSKTNNKQWLDTLNINNVMTQYEKKYPEFKFLGAVPRDYADITLHPVDVKSLNYDDLNKKGINKFGIIFNLDKHNQGGSHWVASFADHNKGLVYFFDSYGKIGLPPKKEIQKFLNDHYEHIKKKGIKPTLKYNEMQHQKGGSECGVYSLYFIIQLLEGRTFEDINKERIPDKQMTDFRDKIFY